MDADAHFDAIAADLAPRGATAGAMFGKRALKAHGKAFACRKGDALALRLGAGNPAHTAAPALEEAELFDPSGTAARSRTGSPCRLPTPAAGPASPRRHWTTSPDPVRRPLPRGAAARVTRISP